MKKIFKYLFILICSIFIFVSCSTNHSFDSDEVFITLNIYNNLDDHIDQITYTQSVGGSQMDGNKLEKFNFDINREGYIFFGGFSKPNGEGKQYLDLNNVLKVEISNYVQYWNYDIYLHYEKEDTDNVIEVSYVLPEDCYMDGELPKEIIRGETYHFPNLYLDEHNLNGWKFRAIYDDFTSQYYGFNSGIDNIVSCSTPYSRIEIVPDLYEYKNRFYIDSPEDFVNIKNHPKGEIIFVNDIDMTGVKYEPFEFSGTINGNNHKISNLTITSSNSNVGLFTTNKGTIRKLSISNITINATSENASYVGALAGISTGTIGGVSVGGTINVKGGIVGGIVGKMTGKEMDSCYSGLTINASEDTTYVGGLVGQMENCKISFCITKANIDAIGDAVGGIVGSFVNSNMEDCYNREATVVGSSIGTGGLIGSAKNSKMLRCESTGRVEGSTCVGGLVGVLDKTNVNILKNYGEVKGLNYVGGIVGHLTSTSEGETTLTELLNEGKVIATGSGAGGIVGYSSSKNATFKISKATNKGEVEGEFDSVGGIVGGFKNNIDFSNENVYTSSFTELINEGNITGRNYIGGLFGSIDASAYNQWGRHPGVKVSITSSSNTASILGESHVGGLVGKGTSQYGKGSVIKDSYSSSTVTANHTIGGIAGYLNDITVDTCSNKDSILIASDSYSNETGTETFVRFGGYCGVGSEIKNCTNELDLLYLGTGSCIGGLVGQGNGNLTSCINKGDIVATEASKVGGIAGYIKVDREYKASNLINEGDLECKSHLGGIIGDFYEEMVALKDNNTHVTTFDNLINYGRLRVGKDYAGVISSVYGNATNENLRYPTVHIAITNMENYGDIITLTYPYSYVGALVGYMYTDNEGSYIKKYVVTHYYPELEDLKYKELVETYDFDVTSKGTAPVAIYAFLISNSFEDCLRTAISIGGDTDTLAAISMSIAEAYYYKKEDLQYYKKQVRRYLNNDLYTTFNSFTSRFIR